MDSEWQNLILIDWTNSSHQFNALESRSCVSTVSFLTLTSGKMRDLGKQYCHTMDLGEIHRKNTESYSLVNNVALNYQYPRHSSWTVYLPPTCRYTFTVLHKDKVNGGK